MLFHYSKRFLDISKNRPSVATKIEQLNFRFWACYRHINFLNFVTGIVDQLMIRLSSVSLNEPQVLIFKKDRTGYEQDRMYCFNVQLTLIFFKRIRINLIVSALQLLCFLLFSIFLLHNIKINSAVAIRRSKLRQILVKFCCVLHN